MASRSISAAAAATSSRREIRLSGAVDRKLSESGQDMEDSGVHLDESPTNFSGDSKLMTYPCLATHPAPSTSSTWSEMTIVHTHESKETVGIEEIQHKSNSTLRGICGDFEASMLGSVMTVNSLRVSCHGDYSAICEQKSVLSPLSTTPLRLVQSLSASEGVNFYPGSDSDLDQSKAEPSAIAEDVFLSAPETPLVRNSKDKTGGMTVFQKIFEPLRRSRSTGNTKDSKEEQTFSLFFRSNSRKEERLSADTGNGSMESELDRDHYEHDRTDRQKSKSLSSEVKERFSIFLRHHTDSSLPFKEGKRDKMTLEAALNWAKSFEQLLADKNGLHWFREFLKSEFSEENIEFWIACEEYKHLKPHKMAAQAQRIFMQFVANQAPREINIDSRTRDVTCENMKQPEATTFEAAQKRIESLMGKDSYPRFIESDLYSHIISGLKS